MFDIKYRIVDDMKYLGEVTAQDFDDDGADIEGFFALDFDGNVEGYYHNKELNEYETGHELITLWFDILIEVVLLLKNKSRYVALKEIETFDSWIEFILENERLIVSYMKYSEDDSNSFILTKPKEEFAYPSWKEVIISFNEFTHLVKIRAEEYLGEVKEVNSTLMETKEIRKIIGKLKSI